MQHPPQLLDVDRRTVPKQLGLASAVSNVGLGKLRQPAKAGLGNGLVAHYQLNNIKSDGTVQDSSPNDNDGFNNGAAKDDGKVGERLRIQRHRCLF